MYISDEGTRRKETYLVNAHLGDETFLIGKVPSGTLLTTSFELDVSRVKNISDLGFHLRPR